MGGPAPVFVGEAEVVFGENIGESCEVVGELFEIG